VVLGGKRRSEEELDDQPVRHSLWEQDTLEAYNELLFGNLDAEVEAVRQRKAAYDEERRLPEASKGRHEQQLGVLDVYSDGGADGADTPEASAEYDWMVGGTDE
jgi:hypothetical protein